MVFVELPIFVRCANELFSDDDMRELHVTLLENPAADLTKDQLRRLADVIDVEVSHGR